MLLSIARLSLERFSSDSLAVLSILDLLKMRSKYYFPLVKKRGDKSVLGDYHAVHAILPHIRAVEAVVFRAILSTKTFKVPWEYGLLSLRSGRKILTKLHFGLTCHCSIFRTTFPSCMVLILFDVHIIIKGT